MGVSNVYNQAKANAIAAVKANLANSGVKKADLKPEYMRMTGSIFDAPDLNRNSQVPFLASSNIKASLVELNKKPVEAPQGKGSNNNELDMPGSASEGRAAAANVKSQSNKAKKLTQKTEENTTVVNKFNSGSERLQTKIVKDNKKFKAQQLKLEGKIKSDNLKLAKLIDENEEYQKQIDDAQHELDSLLARNSFTMGGSGASANNDNQSRITELQTLIGSKVGLMQANGKIVYSLQRNQTRTIKQMNKTNSQYVKVNNQNVKAMSQQQSETSKILRVATEIEKYSALVQTSGQTLDILGQAMVAAGTAPGMHWMIPVGRLMSSVGKVAEMVGQYGVAAANITKTASYAAEGNIMGAMQSAAMAVQAGTAAVKSTKNLKANFDNINTKANEALNKIDADKIAKEQVKQMEQDGVDFKGMSKKDMRKSISKDLQAKMNGKDATLNRNDLLENGKLTEAGRTAGQESANEVGKEFTLQIGKQGGNAKIASKATLKHFRNEASKTISKSSTSWQDRMQQMNQGFMTLASIYGMSQNSGTSNKRHAEQWDLNRDPRMARIMRNNELYRARVAYA